MTGLKNKNLILILIEVRDFFEKNPESWRPGPGNPICDKIETKTIKTM